MNKTEFTKWQDKELKPTIEGLVDLAYNYQENFLDKPEIEDHRLKRLKEKIDELNENNDTDSSETIEKLTELLLKFLDNDKFYRAFFLYWWDKIEKEPYMINEYMLLKQKGGI